MSPQPGPRTYVIRGEVRVTADDPQDALFRLGRALLRAASLEGPVHDPESGIEAADLTMVWKTEDEDDGPE